MCQPDIPDPSATQERAIAVQERIADKSLGLQDKMLTYFQDRQSRLDPLQEEVTRRQLANADEVAAQGRDIFQYNKAVFRPVEQSLVAQAMRESTPEFYERYAQEATARIAAAQANAEGQFERDMSSMGINPASGAYGAGRRAMQIEHAAQLGAGTNEARDRADAMGWARRADVAGLGKGLVGAGNASYGLAIQGNTSALDGSNETTRTAAATLGTPVQYGTTATQAGRNAGDLANDIYRTQAGAGGGDDGTGAAIGAIGTVAAAYI